MAKTLQLEHFCCKLTPLLYFGKYPSDMECSLLISSKFTVFVDLTNPNEIPWTPYDLPPNGVTSIKYPILDRTAKADTHKFTALVNTLVYLIAKGNKVYIHCRGGHGRAPMVASIVVCLINPLGGEEWDSAESITKQSLALVHAAHQRRKIMKPECRKMGAPQTKAQKEFVRDFVRYYFKTMVGAMEAKEERDCVTYRYKPQGQSDEWCMQVPKVALETCGVEDHKLEELYKKGYVFIPESEFYERDEEGYIVINVIPPARSIQKLINKISKTHELGVMEKDTLTQYVAYLHDENKGSFLQTIIEKGKDYLSQFIDTDLEDFGNATFTITHTDFEADTPEGSLARITIYKSYIEKWKSLPRESRPDFFGALDFEYDTKLASIVDIIERRKEAYTRFVAILGDLTPPRFDLITKLILGDTKYLPSLYTDTLE